jgi:hypothetical protein
VSRGMSMGELKTEICWKLRCDCVVGLISLTALAIFPLVCTRAESQVILFSCKPPWGVWGGTYYRSDTRIGSVFWSGVLPLPYVGQVSLFGVSRGFPASGAIGCGYRFLSHVSGLPCVGLCRGWSGHVLGYAAKVSRWPQVCVVGPSGDH